MAEVKRPRTEHPLAAFLRGGIENFQVDRSCALLLLVGAAMAGFGVLAAMVAATAREVDVTEVTILLVGIAAFSALVGGWIWRRSRRRGVRPLGLRIVAVFELLVVVPYFGMRAAASWADDTGGAVGTLLILGLWIGQAVWFWRLSLREPSGDGQNPSTAIGRTPD